MMPAIAHTLAITSPFCSQEEVVAQKEPEVEQIYEAAPAVEFEAETMG